MISFKMANLFKAQGTPIKASKVLRKCTLQRDWKVVEILFDVVFTV